MWSELKRQLDFIQVAAEHGYEVAQRMQDLEGSGQLSDNRKKILSEILRDEKKGGGNYKARNQKKFSPYPAPMPPQVFFRCELFLVKIFSTVKIFLAFSSKLFSVKIFSCYFFSENIF